MGGQSVVGVMEGRLMSTELVLVHGGELVLPGQGIPAIVETAGAGARFAWEEFFSGEIRNVHTRRAYERAVKRFLTWCEGRGLELPTIRPGQVGEYLDQLSGSAPTRKQHMAAIRRFFDRMVNRHVCMLNPAATVRTERYQVIEGKTPEITPDQARKLMKSITMSHIVGQRDRLIIAVMIYTAARVGAVAKLRRKDLEHDGTQWCLRFEEKGGKSRLIPVRHDLEQQLLAYLSTEELQGAGRESPLFPTTVRKTKQLTKNAMTAVDMCRMVKRRMKAVGLPPQLSPHSFRVTTITDLLEQGIALDEVQYLAGHSDPRTTRLYDRRQKKVTRNIVERISI
jgi:integrase/recombinase XerD